MPPPRWWPPALLLEGVGSRIALRGRCPRGAPALAAWPGPIWPCRWWPCQGLGASPSRWIFIFLAAAAGSWPSLAPLAAGGNLLGSAVGSPQLLRAPPGPHRSLQLPPCTLFNYFSQNKRSWRGSGGRAVVLGGPSATPEGQRWWHHGHGPTRRPQRWCPLPWVTTSHRRGSGGTGDTAGVLSPPPPHPRPSAQRDRWDGPKNP